MLIPLNDIILIYEKILEQLNIDYVSVVVYTATDIDSLCTLKILTKLFKSQSIHYKIYPVTTYTELEQRIEDTREYETVKLFMFINCGGFIDLTQKWFVSQQGQGAKVFIFDVNKPIHHKNTQSQSIIVIDDQHSNLQNRITSQDMNRLQQLNQFDFQQDLPEDQDKESEQNQQNRQNSPKRNARTQFHQQLKKHKQILQRKITNYYSTTFFGLPTSYIIYRLIRQLNKANNYALWYAIVGMTSMYLENNISKEILENLTNFFRSDMIRFNPPQSTEKREKGEIFTKKGFYFPLINHWSLYQSMMNSPYLMVRLGLWNDKGVTKLHQILTKIGISLQQSKQQYKYMLKQMKELLQQNVYMIAQIYRLVQITYESFMKQIDSSAAYMASDMYYLITAILQKPMYKSTLEQLSEHRLECFWEAYSLLDGSQEMIKKAVDQFKDMSKMLMKQAKDIIERDNIINMNKINFSNIRCDTKQKRLFQHPNTLLRLAHMLMGIQKQRKQTKEKSYPTIPYVISLFDIQKNVCLIAGVMPDTKNNMGTRFNSAVEKLNIEVKHDKFMANIMIIPKDSLLQFIKEVSNNRND